MHVSLPINWNYFVWCDRNPLPSYFSSHSLIDHPISEKRRTGVIIILMHLVRPQERSAACELTFRSVWGEKKKSRQNGTAYIHNLFQLKALSKVFLFIYLFWFLVLPFIILALRLYLAACMRARARIDLCMCVHAHMCVLVSALA